MHLRIMEYNRLLFDILIIVIEQEQKEGMLKNLQRDTNELIYNHLE